MIRNILTIVFITAGFLMMLSSVIGVLRLKDFYSRMHASGVGETAGLFFCCVGMFIQEGFSSTGLKIIAVFVFAFLANPIGTHILGRVSYKSGYRPWEKNPNKKE